MATITKQGSSWKAVIRRQGYPTQTKSFKLKAAAEQWARQTELEMIEGRYIVIAKDTVRSVFERYRDEVCPNRKGSRWEIVRINMFIRTIKWMKLPISKLNDTEVSKWRDTRLETVTGATVRREMNLLSTVFSHAMREWKIRMAENPVKQVKRPPKSKDRSRRITTDESSTITAHFGKFKKGSASWYAGQMFLFAIESAMRLGEMSALLWDDVNVDRRFLTVRDSKNSDSRHVPLSTTAIKLLLDLPKTDEFVFHKDKATVGTMFRRGCAELGIENLHFHDTRHEGVSRLAKKLNVMELAKVIGHRDLKSLMIYYNPTAEELAGKLD